MRLIHLIQIAQSVQQQVPLALRLHRVLGRVCFAVGVDLFREHRIQMGHLKCIQKRQLINMSVELEKRRRTTASFEVKEWFGP